MGVVSGLFSTARILRDMHDGDLRFETAPGNFTRFNYATECRRGSLMSASVDSVELEVVRLLWVEDDEKVLRKTKGRLTKAGFVVSGVQSGAEAIALMDGGGQFDAVLLDLDLSGRDGIEFAEYLHCERRIAIPIFVYSAHLGDEYWQERLDACGATISGKFPKPFPSQETDEMVQFIEAIRLSGFNFRDRISSEIAEPFRGLDFGDLPLDVEEFWLMVRSRNAVYLREALVELYSPEEAKQVWHRCVNHVAKFLEATVDDREA